MRIGHAIPGVDALLFGHSRPFLVGFGCRFEGMGVLFEVLEAGRENGWLMAVRWEPSQGLLCPIAKDSRIHADRPRHPWRGRFALRAQQAFLIGMVEPL